MLSLFIFSLFEKLFKEFWVIRVTNEKSLTTFHSFFKLFSKEIIIVDSDLRPAIMNSKFEDTMKRLIKKLPTSLKNFIHENSYETFREEALKCIQENKNSTITVYLKKTRDENIDLTSSQNSGFPLFHTGKFNFQIFTFYDNYYNLKRYTGSL